MMNKNKQIEDKDTTLKTNFFIQVWKNLCEYPKSTIFYFLIFSCSLYPKFVRIIFNSADNYFVFLAPIIINMLVFIFIFSIYGKKIFISIFNSFFLISFILFLILGYHNNSLLILAMLILYSFYYTIFLVLIIMFISSKTERAVSNTMILSWIIFCVFIPYIYYFFLVFYHHLTNATF